MLRKDKVIIMKNRKQTKGIFFVIVLLVFAVSLIVLFGYAEKLINLLHEEPDSLGYTDSGVARTLYNGEWYTLNDTIESILVLGIDSMITPDNSKADSKQADFVALVVIDKLNHSFKVLHINRDTMTDIIQINEYGEEYGRYNAQLALAHAYGGSDKLGCRNTVDVVENLLYNISIDHYLSVTMDAVSIINDSIGGVTVTLTEDLPALGEEYVKGAEITLKGDDALSFVRWRGDHVTQSNLERMERQRQYISALFDKYTTADLENTLDTLTSVDDYIVSDCTLHQLTLLLERLQGYTHEGTDSLKGEAHKYGEYVEYHIDEDAAKETVINLFYKIEE